MEVVAADLVERPALEDLLGGKNRIVQGHPPWTKATLLFWESLPGHPTIPQRMTMVQWIDLATGVQLEDAVRQGSAHLAPEARARMSKYAIAPEDVRRARVEFIQLAPVEGVEDGTLRKYVG